MKSISDYIYFFLVSCQREIKNRYLNSGIGFFWLLLNPIIQLIIYHFVFEKIFKVRFSLAENQDFLAFLAVGLWPWVAFSEGLMSGSNTIEKHKSLLQKITIPSELLVLVEVFVPYLIHLLGFFFILVCMRLFLGQEIHLLMFLFYFVIFFIQLLFTYGLALLLAAFQVFLKDTGQILGPLLMVWFYATPIIYPLTLVPDHLHSIFNFNPIAVFIECYRDLLLLNKLPDLMSLLIISLATIIALLVGYGIFKRLSVRFEDLY